MTVVSGKTRNSLNRIGVGSTGDSEMRQVPAGWKSYVLEVEPRAEHAVMVTAWDSDRHRDSVIAVASKRELHATRTWGFGSRLAASIKYQADLDQRFRAVRQRLSRRECLTSSSDELWEGVAKHGPATGPSC